MTADFLMVLRSLFRSIWLLFTSWNIPGTNVSPADWAVFSLVLYFGIKFIKRLLGDEHSADV